MKRITAIVVVSASASAELLVEIDGFATCFRCEPVDTVFELGANTTTKSVSWKSLLGTDDVGAELFADGSLVSQFDLQLSHPTIEL
jgi:hypothetical protein